ncbi:hypothetical protein NP493_619g05054 [Ridgeia piscesae]|uniref:Transcription cofactor vestigial-like protein 4 n=1 Tax=Ridgeia piscesae TaxID=27915 RepID=A0AAD9KSY6_RIDPI|nr:hypothetical protein NP493_619g05054 [Ridgeia piscesae]
MTDLYPFMAWTPWHLKGEAALKRNMEHHGSPLKMKRLREQAPCLIQPPAFDFHVAQSNHQAECNRKCAGTQTSFSSFASSAGYCMPPSQPHDVVGVVAPHPASEERFILDLDQYTKSHFAPFLPPSQAHQRPPRPSSYPSLHQMSLAKEEEMDTSNVPLNLTTSAVPPQSRPSVIITRASSFNSTGTPPMYHKSAKRSSSLRNQRETLRNGWREEVTPSEGCDPIEEHFRRSLGKNYPGYMAPSPLSTPHTPAAPSQPTVVAPPTGVAPPTMVAPPMSLTPPAAAAPPPISRTTTAPAVCVVSMTDSAAVSVAGSVDDHFAKSLGATWNKLKEQDEMDMDIRSGSVDDHFAKALGDTWFKLKASQNNSGALSMHGPGVVAPSSPSLPIHSSAMRT